MGGWIPVEKFSIEDWKQVCGEKDCITSSKAILREGGERERRCFLWVE